jgi:hypothetical protein
MTTQNDYLQLKPTHFFKNDDPKQLLPTQSNSNDEKLETGIRKIIMIISRLDIARPVA